MVGPALFERELLDEIGEVKPEHTHHTLEVAVLIVLGHLVKESVVRIGVVGEVFVGNDLEEEAKDAIGELGAALFAGCKGGLNPMDNVKF